jgi:integrase/recombinase XerC
MTDENSSPPSLSEASPLPAPPLDPADRAAAIFAPVPRPGSDAPQRDSTAPARDPIALLLSDKRSPATRRAYQADLSHFFGDRPSEAELQAFLDLPAPQVALRLTDYKAEMLTRGLAENTVNRRLTAVRALLKFCHRLGLAKTDGRGLVDNEKVRPYRDVRGVDKDALRRLIALPGTETLRGLRDTAILRLMGENALRRAEVCALSVEDFAAEEKRLQVLGKGRGSQKEPISLSGKSVAAIGAYLEAVGHAGQPGAPLFQNVDHRPGCRGKRLTVDGLYYVIVSYGRVLGLQLSCHKLRHSAITTALDLTQGDVRRVQKLSRHADLRTLQVYDDARADFQGQVTDLLSEVL